MKELAEEFMKFIQGKTKDELMQERLHNLLASVHPEMAQAIPDPLLPDEY